VRDEDVQRLGAADTIQNLDAEAVAPAREEIRWQGFSRRDAEAQRGEVVALLGVGYSQHCGIERRHAEEDRRTPLTDDLVGGVRRHTARKVERARSDGEREVKTIA